MDPTHNMSVGLNYRYSLTIAAAPRPKRRLTIGIPTIKRRDGDYFMDMLTSMLNKTSAEHLKEIVFVIFLADLNNSDWKIDREMEIRNKFSEYMDAGSLMVIKAPDTFYQKLPRFGNNSYMNWRTKQNFDYAFLMKYSVELSDMYMQMEDDVIASDGYYEAITEYVGNQTDDTWMCLEFSELGFIGKLYHSRDINDLADLMLMFPDTQPVDYLYSYFNMLKDKGARKIRKPTLFQHMGVHSSLADKTQPLRDRFFDFPTKEWRGDNPPARIFTTLKENEDFATNLPYLNTPGHFWSYGPGNENDTYLIVFESPHVLSKVVVETGSKDHPGDRILNGVLEASVSISGTVEKPVCDDFIVVGHFEGGRMFANEKDLRSTLGLVKTRCLQIRLTKSQMEWVIIKEIAVFLSRN